jgi:hypothetical protein
MAPLKTRPPGTNVVLLAEEVTGIAFRGAHSFTHLAQINYLIYAYFVDSGKHRRRERESILDGFSRLFWLLDYDGCIPCYSCHRGCLVLPLAGFKHSAFNLKSEANLDMERNKAVMRRGLLVEYLAKALLYIEVETHVDKPTGSQCTQDFTLLQKHVCSVSSKRANAANHVSSAAARMPPPPASESTPGSESQSAGPDRPAPGKRKLSAAEREREGAPKRAKARHSEVDTGMRALCSWW